MNKREISTFIIEEHNEAFYIWKYAIHNKHAKASNNTLLHIDEHSDMGSPTLNISMHKLNGNLQAIKDFALSELNIASFIAPAIYDRIFDKVYWIRQRHNKTNVEAERLYIRSYNEEGKKIMMGKSTNLENIEGIDQGFQGDLFEFSFYKQHIAEISTLQNIFLDIDLDYFSCIQNPLENQLKIEISYEEYQKFVSDPYHRIRFFDFGRVGAQEIEGRYYFCLNNYKNKYESPIKVSREKIIERINRVVEVLERQEILPQIITICRSRFSGYAPPDQWRFIESFLTEKLNKIYHLKFLPMLAVL